MAIQKDSKQRIIESAGMHFLQKGFEKTTFLDIAQSCDMSQPALYKHFSNKMNLLKHVCIWSASMGREYIDRQLDNNDTAINNFQKYIFANYDFINKESIHTHSLMAMYYFSLNHPEIKQAFSLVLEVGLKRVESFLYQGMHEKEWKLSKPKLTAVSINSFLVGECYKIIYLNKNESFSKFKKRSWNVILNMIYGEENR